ncbi:hypothetical protein [Streptomyces sp. NPDC006510]|uniref:hypothetical protein n=1 Tax=Streptomyces sp. NPDC006510 TaxID=3155600 RepID=UPI0033BD0609
MPGGCYAAVGVGNGISERAPAAHHPSGQAGLRRGRRRGKEPADREHHTGIAPPAFVGPPRSPAARWDNAAGSGTQWIYDRTTYAFLGERTGPAEAGDAGPAGAVVCASAVLTKAVVDRVGETPAP